MAEIAAQVLLGLPWTIAVTALALAIGLVLGMPVMLARRSRWPWLRFLTGSLITLVRSIPPIVWLFLIFFGIGSGYFKISPFAAAVVGMGLISSAYMAEIYRGALLSIHSGQMEGASALGLHPVRVWIDVVAPQLFRVALPAMATFAIGLLKDSAVSSTIGVPELTFQANAQSMATYRGMEVFSFVAAVYIALSVPVAWLSRILDRRLRAKVSR
ncbi:amino acid ABC transporter permease [Shinella daejeonensis]|uniref:amino acid ABC transporter permease n=1 Tax=Shinella daejeonensis TaxID=659017 RepID=UPI0020C8137E|nr:amino acid ABC transporter permease [Shinella daejeonensis]MCP8894981.1 amino acid ABC transporter permease [Shinella daejeonensis]